MRFEHFAGNAPAKRLLAAAVDTERFPHALVIEGPPGSGRRTLARQLAKAAVCLSEGEKPCGVCPGCIKAAAGGHPDITEVGGDGAARSFHIDAVRAVRDSAYVLPNEAPRRVILLVGAHNMTEQAQNALLKILEEPPAHVAFILTCENRAQLLSTVLSRSVCVALAGVPEEEALPLLRERLPNKDPDELRRALAVFGGIIGRVLDGMEDGSFQRVLELTPAMAEAIIAPDELTLLRLAASLDRDRETIAGVLGGLHLLLRDALVRRCGGKQLAALSTSPETADKLSRALTRPQLMALVETVEGLQQALSRNMNMTLFATLLAARLRAAAGR